MRIRRLRTRTPFRVYAGHGRSEKGCTRSGSENRIEALGKLPPVGCADHALLATHVAIPRMGDRSGDDALLLRAQDVLRAVVDQHVDLDLTAARHLVPRAVEVVERHADLRQPGSGRIMGGGWAVARDVDEVPGSVPCGH